VSLRRTLGALDLAGLRFARTAGHTPGAERAIRAFSKLGEHGLLWIGLGAVGAAVDRNPARPPRRWLRASAIVAGAYGANVAIKYGVRRPRPDLPGLGPLTDTPGEMSFPSAHSTTSFAAVQLFAELGLPKPPLYALAASLATSRLYLGVHYPSDIAAGATLGTAIGRLTR
jgi:membrane-associated phospholipid phosphatase